MQDNSKRGLKIFLIKEFISLTLVGLSIFLPAGSLYWLNGWLYYGFLCLAKILGNLWLFRIQPGLLIQRAGGTRHNTKGWDFVLAPLVAYSSLYTSIVAGLDYRSGWSSFDFAWLPYAGLSILVLCTWLIFWAMGVNPFFDAMVRIQEECGHQVISQGPYQFVRHPGYLGAVLLLVAIPLLLDSVWAFIPALVGIVAVILRTALEDRTLQAELPGYKEYAEKTRDKLFPNIW